MANHSVSNLLTFLVLVFAAAMVGGGGRNRRVHDVEKELLIQELGMYSVMIYNHEQRIYHHKSSSLKYQSLVEAVSEYKPKGWTAYYLKILVTDNHVPKMFDAELMEKNMNELRRFSLSLTPSAVATVGGGGRNRKVHDVEKDLKIQEQGRVCVMLYNYEQEIYHHKNSNLKYQSVVEAVSEDEPKGGTMYHLKILVMDNRVPKMFDVDMVDKHMRTLRRFSPSLSPSPSPSPTPVTK